ncbi:unnamed protein product [Sphacelaria rigidula]
MTAYLHGPIDAAKKMKLRFRGGRPELARKKRGTSSREDKE